MRFIYFFKRSEEKQFPGSWDEFDWGMINGIKQGRPHARMEISHTAFILQKEAKIELKAIVKVKGAKVGK